MICWPQWRSTAENSTEKVVGEECPRDWPAKGWRREDAPCWESPTSDGLCSGHSESPQPSSPCLPASPAHGVALEPSGV